MNQFDKFNKPMQGAQINFSSIFSLFRIQCPFDNVHKNNSVLKGKSLDSFLANNIINFIKSFNP